jgi:NTE family protein
MTAVGLALGGGGVVGIAWEVGVVAGLADALGWDPGAVQALVGTSAGSVVGAQLRHGRAPDDLVAAQRRGAGEGEGEADLRTAPPDLEALAEIFGAWTAVEQMTPEVASSIAARAGTARTVPEEQWVNDIGRLVGTSDWPPGDLRVTGVAVDSGERHVWDATSGVALDRAVAASCAVPGMFPPVHVGPGAFVDGGVWSGSNADVLVDADVEVVLFVGPLVGDSGIGRVSARALERERTALADAGIPLHTVTPGERFAAFGVNLMDAALRGQAVDVGRADGAEAAERLRPLLG